MTKRPHKKQSLPEFLLVSQRGRVEEFLVDEAACLSQDYIKDPKKMGALRKTRPCHPHVGKFQNGKSLKGPSGSQTTWLGDVKPAKIPTTNLKGWQMASLKEPSTEHPNLAQYKLKRFLVRAVQLCYQLVDEQHVYQRSQFFANKNELRGQKQTWLKPNGYFNTIGVLHMFLARKGERMNLTKWWESTQNAQQL